MTTKIGELAQELSRLNPWWRNDMWARNDPDLQEADATGLNYASGILESLSPGGLHILKGPRRVGKTVSVKQAIQKLIEQGTIPTVIVRAATDGWTAKDLRTLIQNTALPPLAEPSRRIWFLDEVSAITGNWDSQVKWLRDNEPAFRSATVVLTGSDATALTEASGTLAGRRGEGSNLDRTLFPIGFRTFVSLVSADTPPDIERLDLGHLRSSAAREAFEALLPWLDQLVRLWELYLSYGGFPQAVAAAKRRQPIPHGVLEDMFNVIAGDAFRDSRLGRNTEMALLERLWKSIATPANLSDIAASVDVAQTTVARHVEYLRDAFLLWRCPQRSSDRWTARPQAQDKIYPIDPLIGRLAHLRNRDRADIEPTRLAEAQVGMGVRRAALADGGGRITDDFLFYVRTPTRKEIDFVSPLFASVAIEGKYIEGGKWKGEAATLNASEWMGVLSTRNVLDLTEEDTWAVPAGVLMYVIDT